MNKAKTKKGILMLAIFALTLTANLARAATPPDELVSSPNLMVSGSSTVYPISSSAQTDFQTSTGITVTLENIGSGPGLDKLKAGTTDVAASSKMAESKYWNDSDWVPGDLKVFAVAKDSVVIIVPKANTWLTNANTSQIADIFRSTTKTGGIALYTFWDEVPGLTGAPHTAIDRITRFMDDGTHDAFNKFFMAQNGYSTGTTAGISNWLPTSHTEVATNQLMVSTVAADANAIGYAAMGIYEGALDQVNGVSINGVAPTTDNVDNATYRGDAAYGSPLIVRYLWYCYNGPIHANIPAAVKAQWVSFIRANMAQYVTINGYIPIPRGDFTSGGETAVPCSNDASVPQHPNLPDGRVNIYDLIYFADGYTAYHSVNSTINPYCDFNADGKVDFDDLLLFADSYIVSPH